MDDFLNDNLNNKHSCRTLSSDSTHRYNVAQYLQNNLLIIVFIEMLTNKVIGCDKRYKELTPNIDKELAFVNKA